MSRIRDIQALSTLAISNTHGPKNTYIHTCLAQKNMVQHNRIKSCQCLSVCVHISKYTNIIYIYIYIHTYIYIYISVCVSTHSGKLKTLKQSSWRSGHQRFSFGACELGRTEGLELLKIQEFRLTVRGSGPGGFRPEPQPQTQQLQLPQPISESPTRNCSWWVECNLSHVSTGRPQPAADRSSSAAVAFR